MKMFVWQTVIQEDVANPILYDCAKSLYCSTGYRPFELEILGVEGSIASSQATTDTVNRREKVTLLVTRT